MVSRYVRVYDLLEPCDDIEIVLGQMATRLGAQKKGDGSTSKANTIVVRHREKCYISSAPCPLSSSPPLPSGGEQDLERAARHFISSYRDGRLGSMTLDSWDR